MSMAFTNPLAPAGFGATAPPPLSLVDQGLSSTDPSGTITLGPFDVSNYQVLNFYVAPFVGAAVSLGVYFQWQSGIGAGSGEVNPLAGGTGIPLARKLVICRGGGSVYWETPNFGPRLTITITPTPAGLWSGPCNVQVRNGPLSPGGSINRDFDGLRGSILAEIQGVVAAGGTMTVACPITTSGLANLRCDHSGAGLTNAFVQCMKTDGNMGGSSAISVPAADYVGSKQIYLPPSPFDLVVVNRAGAAQNMYASVTLL